MAKIDHNKLNKAKSVQGIDERDMQRATIGNGMNGSIKIQLRGDQTINSTVNAIAEALNRSGHRILCNPTLYFGISLDAQPVPSKKGRVNSWDPRITAGQQNKTIPPDDGTIPWT